MVKLNLTALGYIDDTAFIVKTVEDLRTCISSVKKECTRLDLTLNYKKSAILIVNPSAETNKKINRKQDSFMDFPILRSYKYLGVTIKDNLNIDITLNSIENKSLLLFKRISPALNPADLLDWNFLFSVFIGPYIDQLSVNYAYERESKKLQVIQVIRKIYKKFASFRSKTPNSLVDIFIPINIKSRINNNLSWLKHKATTLKD